MTIVLHLMSESEWDLAEPDTDVTNVSLATDGFIHCTDDPEVLLRVANAFYADLPGSFVVILVDTDRLSSTCVWEAPVGPAFAPTFPHVYGPIDRVAIVESWRARRDHNGVFTGYAPIDA